VQEKASVILVVLTAGVVVVAAAVISTDAIPPYGGEALLAQIEQEDSAFCAKFGVAAATPQFDSCVRDLGDLRQHHLDLLRSHWWL
jgi:hypothetical protein